MVRCQWSVAPEPRTRNPDLRTPGEPQSSEEQLVGLPIAQIRLDGGTQVREKFAKKTIDEYAERMNEGDPFSPIADVCGVSRPFVKGVRSQLATVTSHLMEEDRQRLGVDGKLRTVRRATGSVASEQNIDPVAVVLTTADVFDRTKDHEPKRAIISPITILPTAKISMRAFLRQIGKLTVTLQLLAFGAVMADEAVPNELLDQPGIVLREFIYETAPFPECHASTIVETHGALVAAWFGGVHEQHQDVGIWLSRRKNGKWSSPVEVANGVEDDVGQQKQARYPTWNPVLFQPKSGPLLLFYKVGPSPNAWWGMLVKSSDGGKTWSKPRRLPDGILGPIKNKPIELPGGELLCPSSTESAGRPSKWQIRFERTPDQGTTWETTGPLNDGIEFSAIQPSILVLPGNKLQAVGRTRQGSVFQIDSNDGGKTWGKMTATSLPNPNSGIDAVTLRDGRHLIVYNHTQRGRTPLDVAVSHDGIGWEKALVLENQPGEYSYPAIIQSADGLVHVTYTWQRKRIRHIVINPEKLTPDRGGQRAAAETIGIEVRETAGIRRFGYPISLKHRELNNFPNRRPRW